MKLYERNGIWWVTLGTGDKRRRISTKTSNKDDAKRIAAEMAAGEVLESEAALLERAASLRQKAGKKRIENTPLTDCLAITRFHCAPKSGHTLKVTWNVFTRYCHAQRINTLKGVNADTIEAFLATCNKLSTARIYRYVIVAVLAGLGLSFNVKLPLLSKVTRHHTPFTRDEIKKILEKVDARPDQLGLIVRVMLYTGLRLVDVLALKYDDIDWDNECLKKLISKTGRWAYMPIHKDLLARLERKTTGEIFPRGSQIIDKIRYNFKIVIKSLGIKGAPGEYGMHSLRTTFASLCAENGVPLVAIQDWLGHSSQEMTRIYARVESLKAKRETLSRLPSWS